VSEKKVVGKNIAILLGVLCIILVISLTGTIMSFTSMIGEKDNIITSLISQVQILQDNVTDLQNELNELHGIFNPNVSETLRISWIRAGFTSNETKFSIAATIVNNGSVPAENISLTINILFYKFIPQIERSTNRTIEIERLEIGEWCTLQSSVAVPEGESWFFLADFTLYVNGVETDHQSFGSF
jgi:predicted PurR-regulated permease PerM